MHKGLPYSLLEGATRCTWFQLPLKSKDGDHGFFFAHTNHWTNLKKEIVRFMNGMFCLQLWWTIYKAFLFLLLLLLLLLRRRHIRWLCWRAERGHLHISEAFGYCEFARFGCKAWRRLFSCRPLSHCVCGAVRVCVFSRGTNHNASF